MKKLAIIATLGLMSTSAFAQMAKSKEAEKLIDKNTAEARKHIAEARLHEDTQNDAYTWYISGLVEQKDYNTEYVKEQLGQQADKKKMFKALIAEVPFLLKTYELENVPNEKGKIKLKYAKKAKDLLQADYQHLLNAGGYFHEQQDYKTAAEAYESYINVRRHPLFAEDKAISTLDTVAYDVAYYSALMYHEVKDYDKAIEVASQFKEAPSKAEEMHQVLTSCYQAKGDSAMMIKVLEEGQMKYPKSNYFTISLAQIAFNRGQLAESETYIIKALEQDPQNIVLINFLAGLAEKQEHLDKAIEWYKKSLEVKSDDFDANYNLGRTYFNQAVNFFNDPNPTKLTDEKGKECLRQGLPYLEAAYKEKPDEVYYVLGNTYDRLGRKADFERVMNAHK